MFTWILLSWHSTHMDTNHLKTTWERDFGNEMRVYSGFGEIIDVRYILNKSILLGSAESIVAVTC